APALFTHVSIRPNCSSATSARRFIPCSSATSAACHAASPPDSRSSPAIRSRASPSRELSTTRAPARHAILAVASPIPLSDPVITITCSLIGLSLRSIGPPGCQGVYCREGWSVQDVYRADDALTPWAPALRTHGCVPAPGRGCAIDRAP